MDLTPLLFLPGLLCDASIWKDQIEGLLDVCDLHTHPDFYAQDSLGAMAEAALQSAPPRFHLCGHSMGGRVAFEIWRRASERIASLIVLDTGVAPVAPHEFEKRGALVELGRREGMAAVAARWLPPMVHPSRVHDEALMQPLTQMVCRATPEAFARQQHALLTRPDARPLLPQITCPVLVGCGVEDQWSPLSRHVEIAAAIPNARLAEIADAGHMVSVEVPEALTALLRGWLADHRD